MRSVARWVFPLAATMSVLMGACSTSPESLENAVKNSPGVLMVEAREDDGDDDIPGARIPKHVMVLMEGDASAAQVMAVFNAYEDDIDDGDVGAVEVRLKGPKQATLSTGGGIHATEVMVRELVEAQQDGTITGYRRQASPVLPSVRLDLVPVGFDEVVSVADRYVDVEGIELVEVISGGFVLIRDAVNEDLALTKARERFARQVNARFRLTGAVVSGRGPLELFVVPHQTAAAREYVDNVTPGQGLRRVIVRGKRQEAF
jgi:hypothetical protein